ncbi:MAG TPA: MOSC domain-containing protein [Pyrinomonadaceae bacterium]|jgi:MOSC domain-containing protein YiiM
MNGYIFQLNCSRGGVPKLAVEEALLTPTGLACDKQAKRKIHGGPERALCLYALEIIQSLQAEGHPIAPGSAGENVTVAGLDWATLEPGKRLALGDEVLIEISSYTNPCKTIRGSFADGDFRRISQKTHPGESRLYARVLKTGRLAVGQAVRVLDGAEAQGSFDELATVHQMQGDTSASGAKSLKSRLRSLFGE